MANYYNRSNNSNRNNNSNIRRRNSREGNNRVTNYNQRYILDLYVNMYNNTFRQIDLLNDNLIEIRHSIDNIIRNMNDEEYINDINRSESNIWSENLNNFFTHSSNNNTNSTNNTNNNNSTNSTNNASNIIRQSNIISENLNDIFSLLQSYTNSTSNPNLNSIGQLNSDIIANSTRLIPYNEIENPLNDRCPILHEIFQDNEEVRQIIPCGHIFSNNELLRWLERNLHCPVCRFNLRENNVNEIIYNEASPINETVNVENTNLLDNSVNRIGFDIRYDISGNYLLFETYHRI